MSDHPFWQLVSKEPKTDAEKVAIVGVEIAFGCEEFRTLTQEQVYDKLLENIKLFMPPPAQSGKESGE
jgi:hypothetical protein